MNKPTLGQIRAANEAAGGKFWNRQTMKFFKETMRDYRVGKVRPDGKVEVHRTGGRAGSKTFLYDPVTHRIGSEPIVWPDEGGAQ